MELKVKEKGLLADLFRYVKSLCDNHSAKGQCCSDKDNNERASMTITVQKHNVVVTTIIGLKLLRHQQIRSFQHNEKSKYTKEKNVMILYIQHRAWRRLRMGPKIQEQPKGGYFPPR